MNPALIKDTVRKQGWEEEEGGTGAERKQGRGDRESARAEEKATMSREKG